MREYSCARVRPSSFAARVLLWRACVSALTTSERSIASRLTPPAGNGPAGGSSRRADQARRRDRQVLAADDAAVGEDHARCAARARCRATRRRAAARASRREMPAAGGRRSRRSRRGRHRASSEDVVEPLAQRRQRDLEHAEPVVEVLAELAALHRRVQVAVGGGDHADVGRDHARAAEPHELALLEHAQQLGLHRRRHLADLVEEQHVPAACSMRPGLRHRAR